MNERPPSLADLGEFATIATLRAVLEEGGASDRRAHLGIGDDAAVFAIEDGREMVATCDVQVAGRHFIPAAMTAREIGVRAMSVNLSDIAAMGARPERALVSLGLPGRFPVTDLEDLYRGFCDALNPCRAVVSGGNLSRVADQSEWFIDITMLGTVLAGRAVSRRGARPGEIIAVTGTLGASAAGLAVVRHALDNPQTDDRNAPTPHPQETPSVPSLGDARDLLASFVKSHPWALRLFDAYLRPQARVDAGLALADLASAMIDISDGWRSDLSHLCAASGVHAVIESPWPRTDSLLEAARFLQIPIEHWLFGPSDDYELLFTVPERLWANTERALANLGIGVTRIGTTTRATQGRGPIDVSALSEMDGLGVAGNEPGWDHFRGPEDSAESSDSR